MSGTFHGRGVRQGEGERPYDRTRHLLASSGERRVGARPLHETLKHALSAHLVPSEGFATPGLGVLVIDDPECLKVKVKSRAPRVGLGLNGSRRDTGALETSTPPKRHAS